MSTIGVGVLSGAVKLDPSTCSETSAWMSTIIVYLRAWVPALLLPFFLVALLAKSGRMLIGDPWRNAAISDAVEQMRAVAFKSRPGGTHRHRATLFKARRWGRWKRLCIFVRSGHTTQGSRTSFKIPPDEPDSAEGIAGITWKENAVVAKSGLPDVVAESDDALKSEYARQTGVSVEWLNWRTYNARSFMGIPIEVNGALWGVVVLDSADPQGIRPRRALECLARHVSCLLSRTKS
ncbi:MAG: GAF domain-containing protein [Phycisphaerales bacterium]|nr:GAF domain-containing protein [Phycisphaerales bacterium]